MSTSILTSVKKQLGIEETYTHFDPDIIGAVNTALMNLNQMGVGPTDPFTITDSTDLWTDFFDPEISVEAAKTYIYMVSKLIFDPPQTSFALEAMERNITEMEWRIVSQAERGLTYDEVIAE